MKTTKNSPYTVSKKSSPGCNNKPYKPLLISNIPSSSVFIFGNCYINLSNKNITILHSRTSVMK